ncbi:MAG: hypothetical protein FWJ70_18140 [Micromonosporaceae bacterium]|jgi:hypothetical protein
MTSHPLKRRLAGALAVGALLIASLTGCIKTEMNLVLHEDRADGTMIVALDKEWLEFFEGFGDSDAGPSPSSDELIDEVFDTDLEALEGATVEPYEDDRYIGNRYIFEDVPLSALEDDSGEFSITYDPATKTYEVTGKVDMSEMSDTSGEEEFALPPGMMEQLLESFDIVISITFPGEVREHNGELDGTTVTWRPAAGETTELHAVASAEPATSGGSAGSGPLGTGGSGGGDGSSSTTVALVVALVVVVVAVAVGLTIWFVRRRRRPAEPVGAAGTAAAPQSPPGSEG